MSTSGRNLYPWTSHCRTFTAHLLRNSSTTGTHAHAGSSLKKAIRNCKYPFRWRHPVGLLSLPFVFLNWHLREGMTADLRYRPPGGRFPPVESPDRLADPSRFAAPWFRSPLPCPRVFIALFIAISSKVCRIALRRICGIRASHGASRVSGRLVTAFSLATRVLSPVRALRTVNGVPCSSNILFNVNHYSGGQL